MNDQEQSQPSAEEIAIEAAARDALVAKATMLGVEFHPKLSSDKLAERIREHVAKEAAPKTDLTKLVVEAKEPTKAEVKAEKETDLQKRLRLKREASELVRIILTCKNPLKADHGGQVFSVGNSNIGHFTKYVPFENQEGWHVPRIILQLIKDSEYQHHYKDPKNPNVTLSKRAKEFVVDILDPLTTQELHDLAQRQAMSGSIG